MDAILGATLLGIAAGLFWGAGDFWGGYAARQTSVYGAIIGTQGTGVLILLGCAWLFNDPWLTTAQLGWAVLGGLCASTGILALYLAMQRGAVSLAAPVSAVLAAVIPVVVSASSEGLPRPLQLGGFGLAFLAIILISRPANARLGQLEWRSLGLPMLAGFGFGFFLVFLNRASAEAVFYPSVISRLASLGFQVALAARQGASLAVPRRLWLLIVFAGTLTAIGNVSFSAAGQVGRLDITSVLASLYPAATVALAWLVLKERLRPSQAWGIGAALLAILLIAWPE